MVVGAAVVETLVDIVVAGGAVVLGLAEDEEPLPAIGEPGFLSVRRPGRYGRSL